LVVISPRNNTSLPTTSEVMTPGYCLARREILQPVAAEPDALDDLQAYFCGLRRHLIEAVLDRVGAHAVGYFGELREILGDLLGRDMGSPQQRRLRVAERRVGDA